jgi:hypothetical protein
VRVSFREVISRSRPKAGLLCLIIPADRKIDMWPVKSVRPRLIRAMTIKAGVKLFAGLSAPKGHGSITPKTAGMRIQISTAWPS